MLAVAADWRPGTPVRTAREVMGEPELAHYASDWPLLTALIEGAISGGLPALSLSVEADNPAAHLYRRLGFRQVGTVGGSLTMLLELEPVAA